MADPATIAVTAALVSTAGETIAGVRSAQARSRFARQEAKSVRDAARSEEEDFTNEAQRILAKRRAILASSGVDISSGSPLLLQLDEAAKARKGALNIRHRGRLAELGLKAESDLARRSIGSTAFGGVARGASILGSFIGRRSLPSIGDVER